MIIAVCLSVLLFAAVYWVLFYPAQIMPVANKVEVSTPEEGKYHDDCLHPCVRTDGEGGYIMVQSSLYDNDESLENPIFYKSDDLMVWNKGVVVHGTPEKGYNSDPNVFVENGRIWVFWREFQTDKCDEENSNIIVFGSYSDDGSHFSTPAVFLKNSYPNRIEDDFPSGDKTMCETLVKHNGKYYFYCVDEDFSTYKCNGIAIWEGTSLETPDFQYLETVPVGTVWSVGKWLQKKVAGHLFFIPKPTRQEIWHFDLFEYGGELYMICGTKPDRNNIMIARSKDWRHFKMCRKPLVNNNCSENQIGYRQYYYKSTGFVEDGQFHLYYTSQDLCDSRHNVLYHCALPVEMSPIFSVGTNG